MIGIGRRDGNQLQSNPANRGGEAGEEAPEWLPPQDQNTKREDGRLTAREGRAGPYSAHVGSERRGDGPPGGGELDAGADEPGADKHDEHGAHREADHRRHQIDPRRDHHFSHPTPPRWCKSREAEDNSRRQKRGRRSNQENHLPPPPGAAEDTATRPCTPPYNSVRSPPSPSARMPPLSPPPPREKAGKDPENVGADSRRKGVVVWVEEGGASPGAICFLPSLSLSLSLCPPPSLPTPAQSHSPCPSPPLAAACPSVFLHKLTPALHRGCR